MDIYKLLGINRLEAVLNRVNRQPIKENIALCCRDRLNQSGCDLCLKCPVGAINLQSEPFINDELCLNCGLCVNLCPTGVFEPQPGDDYYLALIKTTVAKRKSSTAVFSCAKSKEQTEGQELTAIELPCLARLNETVFIGAASFGLKLAWLFTANCQNCSLASGLTFLEKLAYQSEQLVKGYGLNLKIVFSSQLPPESKTATNQVDQVKKDISAYSRRELFTNLGRQLLATGIDYTESKWQEFKENMSGPKTPEFSYKLPRKRELFLAVINKLEKESQLNGSVPANPFFYSYTLDAAKCNFCLNCVKFCPTKALALTKTETGGYLSLAWPYCVGCNLCVQVCLPQAITKKEEVLSLKQNKRHTLVEFTQSKCKECKQQFLTVNKEQEYCFFCQHRRTKLQDDYWG